MSSARRTTATGGGAVTTPASFSSAVDIIIWNNYWYPAFGYSPFYNNYVYSEPIYGYNNLAPGQVIQNVQLALRNQGYYPGAIDGLIGTQTRAALSAFQRDHGLIVTSAVDEPTLVTLGLA